MLTLQECLDFSGLTAEEINLIAEHRHVPDIVAAELGSCLIQSNAGTCLIKRYMLEEIEHAELHGHLGRAHRLHHVFEQFNAAHPTSDVT